MRIRQLHAHFLISIGNYSNERIGFTVDLDEDEDVQEVVDLLRQKAKEAVGLPAEELYNKKFHAERAYKETLTRLETLRKEWDATAEFLKAQGINPQAPSMPQFRNLLQAAAAERIEHEIDAAEFVD